MNRARNRADFGTLATGIALVAMIALSFVMDAVSSSDATPGADASASALAAYVSAHDAGLTFDVVARFLILVLLFVPIALGLARHVRSDDEQAQLLARMIPLFAVWLLATGGVANSLLAAAVFEGKDLAAEPGVTRMLHLGISALFLLTMLPHGAMIAVTSEAGRRTNAMPMWLNVAGYLVAAACLIAVLGMPASLGFVDEGLSGVFAAVAYSTIGLWYLVTGIVLVIAWWRRVPAPSELVTSSV